MDYFVKQQDRWSIDPEETLLDSESARTLDDSKFEVPLKARNILILLLITACIVGVFVVRLAYLQVSKGSVYGAFAQDNRTRHYPVLARRGIVYDRNGIPLVENVPSFDVVVVPADLPRDKEKRRMVGVKLAEIVKAPSSLVLEQFSKMRLADVHPVLLKENIDRDQALVLETALEDMPGIELKKNAVRSYADGSSFSHVMGYVGRASEDDLRDRPTLFLIDYVGKSGVEASYDAYIRGQNGIIEREIDAVNRFKKEAEIQSEEIGAAVTLTLNADLQKKINDVLMATVRETPSATGAAAVALNPKTGEVLALVSLPSYDNNIFSSAAARQEFENIGNDSRQSFFNRALSGLYPPGSSIKPFIAAAALEEKVITPRTTIESTGAINVQSPYDPNTVYTFRDWKAGGHGMVNVFDAIAESVNTFFYTVGGGYGDIKGLGIERIKKHLDMFGFGKKTSLDMLEEDDGIVPDPAWKEKTKGERWLLGDTYNTSIGQGNLLVTPLQLARGYAAIANGGKVLEPFIVKRVVDKDKQVLFEHEPKVVREHIMSDASIDVVQKGMRKTVTDGTARRLADLSVAVAGKTGTAQASGGKTHAWFSSFAPYNDPEIVLVILIENGGEGSSVATPAAHEIYNWYFKR